MKRIATEEAGKEAKGRRKALINILSVTERVAAENETFKAKKWSKS